MFWFTANYSIFLSAVSCFSYLIFDGFYFFDSFNFCCCYCCSCCPCCCFIRCNKRMKEVLIVVLWGWRFRYFALCIEYSAINSMVWLQSKRWYSYGSRTMPFTRMLVHIEYSDQKDFITLTQHKTTHKIQSLSIESFEKSILFMAIGSG